MRRAREPFPAELPHHRVRCLGESAQKGAFAPHYLHLAARKALEHGEAARVQPERAFGPVEPEEVAVGGLHENAFSKVIFPFDALCTVTTSLPSATLPWITEG